MGCPSGGRWSKGNLLFLYQFVLAGRKSWREEEQQPQTQKRQDQRQRCQASSSVKLLLRLSYDWKLGTTGCRSCSNDVATAFNDITSTLLFCLSWFDYRCKILIIHNLQSCPKENLPLLSKGYEPKFDWFPSWHCFFSRHHAHWLYSIFIWQHKYPLCTSLITTPRYQ